MGAYLDRLAAAAGNFLMLLGRAALAAIFVVEGYRHLSHIDAFAHSLAARGLAFSGFLAVIAACIEFFGSVAIVLGFRTRQAAFLVAAFCLVAALIAHRFWQITGPAHDDQFFHFMKNIAICGGCLLLFVAGPGAFAIDRRRR